jgi:hypothetical protein
MVLVLWTYWRNKETLTGHWRHTVSPMNRLKTESGRVKMVEQETGIQEKHIPWQRQE